MNEAAAPRRRRYRDSRRRLLVDMHIPDWDDRFLAQFEPQMLADATERAGGDGAMVYFQNHVGLCFWPTASGVQHKAFAGRDPVSEALQAFERRGCAPGGAEVGRPRVAVLLGGRCRRDRCCGDRVGAQRAGGGQLAR